MSRCGDSGGLWGDTWRKEKKPWGEDHQDVSLQTSRSLLLLFKNKRDFHRFTLDEITQGSENCLCLFVSIQSPQHVDIAEVFADQCRENLERSPCKDIFSNCRKWGPAHSHPSPALLLLLEPLFFQLTWLVVALLCVCDPGPSTSTWVLVRLQTTKTACTMTGSCSGRC